MKRSVGGLSSVSTSKNPEKRFCMSNSQLKGFSETDLASFTIDQSGLLESIGNKTIELTNGNSQIQFIKDETLLTEDEMHPESDTGVSELTNGIIAQHMDITEPLTTLRALLEQRMGVSLSEYQFYLQDSQELDDSKNLVNQCVQGEGLVQVNVEIVEKNDTKKINIVDVLKPAEEIMTVAAEQNTETNSGETPSSNKSMPDKERVTRWIASPHFKLIQENLKYPAETNLWSEKHVLNWIKWCVGHFGLLGVKMVDWNFNGKELCQMAHSDFTKKVPCDPSDLFWTHLELLRKCNIVAVVQLPSFSQEVNQIYTIVTKNSSMGKAKNKSQKVTSPRVAYEGCPGNRTGNNGQVQLWQFLLEMLTDCDYQNYIQWLGTDGEFKLRNPEMVAHLWGQRKNKPTMNYEKLSRALRYYYDGDMIAKVHGKRFVYKFVCDLKSLLGYSAAELKNLVRSSQSKEGHSNLAFTGSVSPSEESPQSPNNVSFSVDLPAHIIINQKDSTPS